MPCALCGNQGHNRRTCQQWQVLEASRQQEERIHEEQTVPVPINIKSILSRSVFFRLPN